MVYLKASCEELVLHLQVVALVHFSLEGLIEYGVVGVILNVLPASVAVSVAHQIVKGKEHNATQAEKKLLTLFPVTRLFYFACFCCCFCCLCSFEQTDCTWKREERL